MEKQPRERGKHMEVKQHEELIKILPSLNDYALNIEMTPCVPEELKYENC